jgi:hypothetical protein
MLHIETRRDDAMGEYVLVHSLDGEEQVERFPDQQVFGCVSNAPNASLNPRNGGATAC